MTTTGHCLCKATTYSFEGAMAWRGHCHCESCRRNCSAPFTTFFGVPRGQLLWTGKKTGSYQSSPGVHRLFCSICGSPMAYDSDEDLANIHLYAASLADYSQFQADFHVFYSQKVPWVVLGDRLEIHPELGGVN